MTKTNGSTSGAAIGGRATKKIARESFRPLRLRGRRELVTAMVDALNDILRSERTLF